MSQKFCVYRDITRNTFVGFVSNIVTFLAYGWGDVKYNWNFTEWKAYPISFRQFHKVMNIITSAKYNENLYRAL